MVSRCLGTTCWLLLAACGGAGKGGTDAATSPTDAAASAPDSATQTDGASTPTDGASTTDGATKGMSMPPDVTKLPVLSASTAANLSAYMALDVPGMMHGKSFADPVTSVRTVKITDSTTPGTGSYANVYSTEGLQISQAWGTNADSYTLYYLDVAGGGYYLVDYQFGGTTSNYRGAPNQAAQSSTAFSRKPGQERILYVATGSYFLEYDTSKSAWVTALPSAAWKTTNVAGIGSVAALPWTTDKECWLQVNSAETLATAINGGNVTAVDLSSGKVVSQNETQLDEIYNGYGDYSFVNNDSGPDTGGVADQIWNMTTNTVTKLTALPNGVVPAHLPSMNGFWAMFDSNHGAGTMPIYLINYDGTNTISKSTSFYWGQWHSSGHWQQASGASNQYVLNSADSDKTNGNTASVEWNNFFVNTGTAVAYVLGGHYSCSGQSSGALSATACTIPNAKAPYGVGGANAYWSQAHSTQSTDGRLVMFTSNMLNTDRDDLFVQEVP